MSVFEKLASSLNRRDEKPNLELAQKIAAKKDKVAVKELISLLQHKSKDIQFDCIKVLYEIGELQPSLIKEYTGNFIDLLESKHNRNIWGAMHALDCITPEDPKQVYSCLSKIMEAAEKGSVITRDHAVGILLKLCTVKQYGGNAFILFIELIKDCPTNQLAMYAENAMNTMQAKNKPVFIQTLRARLDEIEKETLRKRVEKVIKKLS
ncbi:MAG: hypothetical protein ABI741_05705 [Ferruginibacter sp.]